MNSAPNHHNGPWTVISLACFAGSFTTAIQEPIRMKPTVALYLPPKMIRRMFRESDLHRLRQAASIIAPVTPEDQTPIYPAMTDAEVAITGWGTPVVDEHMLAGAPKLKLLAHSAGSVKHVARECVYDHKIRVTTAAAANAVPVAEFTVAMMVSLLKQVPWIGPAYSRGDEEEVNQRKRVVRELSDIQVGLVGASRIGRLVVHLLRSFSNITVKMFDPFLSDGGAAELGVIKASLEEVCQCEVISVHAPQLPETRHMINAKMLALMPDHAVFINTSRGSLVDETALLVELHKRPLYAALDVTDPEPPASDSPLRSAPNLVLTPHIAGAMHQARQEMGKLAIDETLRFLRNEPLQHEVTRAMLATQA
jgi:phosphoglycerate dehydrogenase-like enzyme